MMWIVIDFASATGSVWMKRSTDCPMPYISNTGQPVICRVENFNFPIKNFILYQSISKKFDAPKKGANSQNFLLKSSPFLSKLES